MILYTRLVNFLSTMGLKYGNLYSAEHFFTVPALNYDPICPAERFPLPVPVTGTNLNSDSVYTGSQFFPFWI